MFHRILREKKESSDRIYRILQDINITAEDLDCEDLGCEDLDCEDLDGSSLYFPVNPANSV